MKRLGLLVVVALVALVALVAQPAQAASPLSVVVRDGDAFRHVLETGDWLVLTRLSLLPTSEPGFTDTFSAHTTGGDFDDPVKLTNRVRVTGAFSTDVFVKAGTTTITSACLLLQDKQSINCEDTGLADATYTVIVTYRSGWSAYTAQDVFIYLLEGSTIVAERTGARVGCGLVGLYLTAADVTTLGLTWADSGITLLGRASPALWASPANDSGVLQWRATGNLAATKVELRTRLKTMLREIENETACGISVGTLDQADFITAEGTVISIEAFSLIREVLPGEFAASRLNVAPTAITTPTVSMIRGVETAVEGTSLKQDVDAVHPMTGMVVTLIGSVILGGMAWVWARNQYIAVMVWYLTLMAGWLLFSIPFVLVFLPAAALAALGFMYLSKRIFAST